MISFFWLSEVPVVPDTELSLLSLSLSFSFSSSTVLPSFLFLLQVADELVKELGEVEKRNGTEGAVVG